jgi:ABC-type polysaccharide/polyol phosphate export permease
VYFRDVRYLVTAGLLLWFYVTPVIYPGSLLGGASRWLELNPMTGIVGLFQRAVVGPAIPIGRPLLVSVAATLILAAIGVAAHRRYDRLFVDLL